VDSTIVFISIAIISSPVYPLSLKFLVVVSQLADHLSVAYTFQSGFIQRP